jgi:hypothetical protein
MADDYDPFNLKKHPGYYAELVQERDPTHDVAASYVKNHQYDGGILGQLERNPHGLGDSPLPFDPSGAELRSTSEGGSAFTERPKDHLQPVAELISPTLGAFGAGQMAGTAYKEAGEGDYQEAGMSLVPLLAGMVVPGAPKGVRGPKVLPREIDSRGFYSPSLEAVKGLGQETGTVQQFRSMLLKAGGKPKELEAVGFDKAFPDPNAKVSRQDIEQYLRDNRVQLGEKRYGDVDENVVWKDDPNALLTDIMYDHGLEDTGRFMSYSTPGGIPGSYREVVTTLPEHPRRAAEINVMDQGDGRWDWDVRGTGVGRSGTENSEAAARAAAQAFVDLETARNPRMYSLLSEADYTSSHWPGITNPLLHYRTKDFAGGVRVLDEMQSDWAQRARDQGTRDPVKAAELKVQHDAALKARDDVYAEIDAMAKQHGHWNVSIENSRGDTLKRMREEGVPGAQELTDRMLKTGNDFLDISSKYQSAKTGVPSAPYISNTSDWVDLGLKQALIDAAKDPSVNRLAWAPGGIQADRYSLKNTISGIRYSPETKSIQVTHPYDDAGRWYSMEGATGEVGPERLPELLGKELAEKLLAAPMQPLGRGAPASYQAHTLTDLGSLEIGGRGMKSFYGDMTPEGYQSGIVGTRLQKLVKGLDPEAARVEPTKIEIDNSKGPSSNEYDEIFTSEQYPSVKITPAMREKILKEGLPLFNVAALSALVSRILGQGQPDTEGEDGGGF